MKLALSILTVILICPAFAAVCEATGTGRCFYIDPNGDDTNPGTEAQPWQTAANIKSTIYAQYRTPNYVQLLPGDYIYFRGGTHSTVWASGGDAGPNAGTYAIVYMRGVTGDPQRPITFKGYPGEVAELWPSSPGMGIYVEGVRGLVFENFRIRNSTSPCMHLAGTDSVVVRNLTVQHCHTIYSGGNTAGIILTGATNTVVEQNTFSDTWTSPVTYRGWGLQMFGGAYTTIRNNRFINTERPIVNGQQQEYPGCMMYKHASNVAQGWTHVVNNTFQNCDLFGGIGLSTQNLLFSRNVIIDGNGPQIADFGGPAYHVNQTYEYNTIVRAVALIYLPSRTPYNNLFPVMPLNITYRNNIVWTLAPNGSNINLIIVATYGPDAEYDSTQQSLTINDNCYYLGSAPQFDMYSAGGSWGARGKLYSLTEWNNTLGFDGRSLLPSTTPFMDAAAGDYRVPADHACAQMGAFAQANSISIMSPNDLNRDGQVTAADVVLVANCIGAPSAACILVADRNTDGIVDVFDAVMVAGNQ